MEDQQYTISVEHGPAQEPNSESDTTPPNTILVRWKKELLLLDAWNEEGDKLRTPPSLIGEAIKHFRIGKKQDIDNFRLAVHELVDDRPALLFLGLTALRFVENGRVLELIDLRESSSPSPSHSRPSSPAMKPDDSGTETYKTAPLADDRSDISSDLSTVTSSESDTSQDTYYPSTTSKGPSPRTLFFLQGRKKDIKRTYSPGEIPSRDPVLIRNESHATLVGASDSEEEEQPAIVYVHPQHGAVFRRSKNRMRPALPAYDEGSQRDHIQKQRSSSEKLAQQPDPAQSLQAAAVYDFRNHHTLPRPTLSRPTTPSNFDSPFVSPRQEVLAYPKETRSHTVSRQSSVASNMSRLAGRAPPPKTQDDDPWLSSDSREKWKAVHFDRNRLAPRNRSYDRIRYPSIEDHPVRARPTHLPRSHSHIGLTQARTSDSRRDQPRPKERG